MFWYSVQSWADASPDTASINTNANEAVRICSSVRSSYYPVSGLGRSGRTPQRFNGRGTRVHTKIRDMTIRLAKMVLLFTLMSAAVWAQVNVGEQKPEASLPFTMTTASTFELPWRLAFLPDGRMLITEKVGPVWLVSPQGQKISPVANTPAVYWQNQNGMLGVFVSPHYATDQSIYLTYVEPGDYGGRPALARGTLNATATSARLENFEVLWRQMPKGKGGQSGAAVAFSPDGQSLFLTVGDRQRFTPAQDPDQPVGKILHLTLDGKPAPGNPNFGKTGAATIPLIDPPSDTKPAKTAQAVSTYAFPGPN